MAKRRRRGVVLTPEGLEKFQAARLKHEAEENYGERYTYEKLSELTYLDIHTIKRVIECQEGVDKRTLERIFISFNLDLNESCYTKPNPHRRQHWGEAMCVSDFYGRTEELKTLETWLLKERCRVITLLGMGGMGKTCLSVKLAKDIQERFDLIMWCSLRDAPSATEVVTRIIEFLSDGKDTPLELPESFAGKVNKLIEYLRNFRCLILLDNLESLLCDAKRAGIFREGFEDYGDLLLRLGETEHISSVILTTREKPKEIAHLEGEDLLVRTFRLYGLEEEAGEQILKQKKLQGSDADYSSLIDYYGGNALALKVVATTIKEIFQGDIPEFLNQETAVFGDIRDLLAQQFNRLTSLEREIMYWLAINREPLTIEELRQDLVSKVPRLKLLEALESLSRRSLVERDQGSFTLQNVVMEYAICRFLERVCEELIHLELELFRYHAIIKATAKDYVRETQIRLILEPLLEQLETHYKSQKNVTKQLDKTLTWLREKHAAEDSYAGGNLINMLCHQKADFTGYDFSNLAIWQADFRNSCFHDVNLAHSDLSKSVFTETFGGVLSVAFSPDGKFLAKGDMNGEVRLYRVSDWQQILSFKGHSDWVSSLTFSPDSTILATASVDQTIKFWCVLDAQLLQVLQGHSNGIWSVDISPDGQLLASGSDDHQIKIWDVESGECIETYNGHTSLVRAVAFSADGQVLASGSSDKTLKLWDIDTGQCLKTIEAHEDGIWSVDFSPDGQILATASSDHTVKLWDTNTSACIKTLVGHKDIIWSVAFSADGQYIASGSWDLNVKLWSASTGKCLKTFSGHNSSVRTVSFSPDSKLLVSGSEDQSLKLWSVEEKSSLRTFQGNGKSIWSISLCPRGEILASSGHDQYIQIWDINTGKCLDNLEGHKNMVRSVAFSPDQQFIASGSDDNTVRVWNRKTGKSKVLYGHDSWVWSVVFSNDGRILASGSTDSSLKLWDVKTSKCIQTLKQDNHGIIHAVFSSDNRLVATSGTDQLVKVWDIETGDCLRTMRGHQGWVYCVSFLPDGKTLVSGSSDQTIKIWDIETGQCLKTLIEHEGWVWSVAYNPVVKILASGGTDKTIKLWNVKTGECLKTLKGHDRGILSVIFDHKGHQVISSSEDETIRFWDVITGECTKILRSKKPYEKMLIDSTDGLTESRISALKSLGAVSLSDG